MISKNLKLTSQVVKKNPIIWVVSLLIIVLNPKVNFNLFELLQNLMINTNNPMVIGKLIFSAIGTIIMNP
jgi:hypothetical protein